VRLGVTSGLGGMAAAAIVLAAAPAAWSAPVKLTRVGAVPGVAGSVYGFVRTPDGTLHIVRPTSANGANGLTADAITPSGTLRPAVTALSTQWGVSVPGLVTLPDGSLDAFFGAISPSTGDSGVWEITSTNGDQTWSAPVDVHSGPLEALAYGSAITARIDVTTPVLVIPQAGNVVVQQGLGPNTPTYTATTSTDDFATNADAALDAATGVVVASWHSAQGSGADYLQGVAPNAGAAQKAPGQPRDDLVLAGRDKGPGVFGAYTTDDRHVRLLRYGGGSVAVGSLASAIPAAMGVATGVDGRIWVMWGSDNGNVAVTRSNRAVTRFEPVRRLSERVTTLTHLAGDGRLGPLDLLVDQVASTNPLLPRAVYHARVPPVLSAAVSVRTTKSKKSAVTSHMLTVTVTDAGDAVSGATVTAAGHIKKTGGKGVAKIILPGAGTAKVTVSVTAPGYAKLTAAEKL
jgi:hypothetical protein